MPVEIRELVIRAVVNSDAKSTPNPIHPPTNPTDQEQLIQECVRQVLKIIKKEKER